MESEENEIARRVVEAIIKDFTDRRGLRQAWDALDDDIKADIKQEWYDKALAVARPIVQRIKGE